MITEQASVGGDQRVAQLVQPAGQVTTAWVTPHASKARVSWLAWLCILGTGS